ncbi:MAG: hypothetical protein J5802_01030 [Butyrivibrio sp.]|nr:hypothetical protein [Butyrivibrio sp.]
MRKPRFLKVLFGIMCFLCLFILLKESVCADIGPKPSITVTVTNAPRDYYIALLGNHGEQASEDSELKIKGIVTLASVREYLENFSYQGWDFFESPVGDNIYYSNYEHTYVFSYMVPNPFRFIVIKPNGEVHVSKEYSLEQYNYTCTYDFAEGAITEYKAVKAFKRIFYVIFCYVMTILLEFGVFCAFRYPRTRSNIVSLAVVNALTNIPLNIFLAGFPGGWEVYVLNELLEILILIIESIIYAIVLKNAEGKRKPIKSILYGISANSVSAILGSLLSYAYIIYVGV